MFQRILVAVDASPARHSVIDLAGDMARLAGAEVRVVHVAPTTATLAAVVSLEDDDTAEDILDEALTRLRAAGVTVEGTAVRAFTTQIATTISSAAEDWGADLLVLSPHHRGALEALVHPRISDAVAHTGRIAVLLAPDHGPGDAH
ncbi:universal stress protein [Streptomyces griseosporeus]|uniref:universal stress protein n=1 Tax=Streptomyces griseosporeus TaxID=1910 RepID=UPI00167D8E9D|nr:universal stress protein [Streptomyces griseosporeus]GHF37184.1 universal stress protein [Streptomyces griseosporeus]